jgi:hypothetical protein
VTPSEEIVQRYAKIEREADSVGRLIGVRRLRPSQQTRIAEMTPGLDGDTEMRVLDEMTGAEKTISISRRLQITLAASVCEIDNNPIPFPRTRGELDAIYDRLDKEGVEAAMIAYARLFPKQTEPEDEGAADTTEAAKK